MKLTELKCGSEASNRLVSTGFHWTVEPRDYYLSLFKISITDVRIFEFSYAYPTSPTYRYSWPRWPRGYVSPRDPRFAGSNPTEVDGFFQDVKILGTNPPGGTSSWGSRV